ncbi:MAG: sulfatase-like hydrolase/transferase [Bacteroides sp.]|nr:sulfatase-like hydrolase/transferase [Bacteroides sp.]MCM1413505.1 sulfatase-like hydrolase/transferase [Bacteroides sp.]MCM1471059.1 sulfatase-like hydrolase/transferase [Bacteroides sp.]
MNAPQHTRSRLSETLYRILRSTVMGVVINLLMVYVCYFICRVVFLALNSQLLSIDSTATLLTLLRGGLLFDTSAICYTNALYILLALFPLHYKERPWFFSLTKWIFVIVNSLCILINLADAVFFEFRHQRTTMAIFQEFGGEGNLASIVGHELVSHWYLVLLFVLMVWALIRFYRRPARPARPLRRYYINRIIWFVVIGFAAFCGMRGNVFFLSATRPISTNYAFHYTTKPEQTGAVLNTPFSMIRTIGQTTMPTPHYFATQEELDAVFTPLHLPSDSAAVNKKNVVIIIVESFAREFIGGLNKDLDGGTYKGYTPWTDSMLDSVMWHDEMLANTYYSIDAPPAVLASIPRADRPFVVSPHSVNHINSIASELKNLGYTSAFFHGADNESLGIHAFTRQAGFDRYYGQNEFYADSRFGGRKEFDGYWGVWDEPFLQFFCAKLSEMPQPFVGAVFTLSSHHPFKVPEKYRDRFKDEGQFELHKCIRYTDYALQQFFESARKQPWFNNTIFVITADHTSSKRTHEEYKNEMGNLRIPILYYDPSGELPRGRQKGLSQQIDIMPTLLGIIGYDRPYIAFGKDLLSTPADQTWGFNWNSQPVYVKGNYMMIYDGERVTGLYNIRTDRFERTNLAGKGLPEEADMLRNVQAIMQSYLSRMNADDVTVKTDRK